MLCNELGIEDNRLILPRQTHGDKTIAIDRAFMQMTREEQEKMLYGVDAIITELPRTCIGVSTADCIPVLLSDSVRGVVAAIHAGWRGTVARIAEKCIKAMSYTYGCTPGNIKAVIAPGISMDSFEVGDEVYETFKENGLPPLSTIVVNGTDMICGEGYFKEHYPKIKDRLKIWVDNLNTIFSNKSKAIDLIATK
jgi:YfiH family protein